MIISINRGGLVPGVYLSHALKVPHYPIHYQTRDFVHVYDLVRGIIKAATSKKIGKIYNLGGGKEVKVNKIAKLIGGKTINIPKRPGEPNRSLADISKIKKLPRICSSFVDYITVGRFLQWY